MSFKALSPVGEITVRILQSMLATKIVGKRGSPLLGIF